MEKQKEKTIKEIQRKADKEFFSKGIRGEMHNYYNIKPKEDKSQKMKSYSK